ncbi:MAG: type II toxin-antitoxin system RelE/ParE family toxin, partial [Nitrospinales bacterium]
MIKSFKCRDTEKLYNLKFTKKFSGIERPAIKRLKHLNSTPDLKTLANIPGNRFEALKGDRKGQYSIRISDQWRICFK